MGCINRCTVYRREEEEEERCGVQNKSGPLYQWDVTFFKGKLLDECSPKDGKMARGVQMVW